MPMFESSVAITTSQQPEDRRVAGEAVAGVDTDERNRARQLGEPQEREAVESGHAAGVGVARATATTFGEEHDRQPQLFGELEQAVLLAVVAMALRAGQHRVVVGHGDARAARARRTGHR